MITLNVMLTKLFEVFRPNCKWELGPTVNQDSIDNKLTKSITIILVNEMNLGLGLGDPSWVFPGIQNRMLILITVILFVPFHCL